MSSLENKSFKISLFHDKTSYMRVLTIILIKRKSSLIYSLISNFNLSFLKTFIFLFLTYIYSACASPNPYERMEQKSQSAKPKAAAYGTDGFYLRNREPAEREFLKYDFYFKNCSLVSRNPFPGKVEYECREPEPEPF